MPAACKASSLRSYQVILGKHILPVFGERPITEITRASLLIQQSESLAYVRDQLGHHSIKLTVDTYGHLAPGGNRATVDKLDDPAFQALNALHK